MQENLEVLDGLSRRLDIVVPRPAVETEIRNRLKRLSKTVRMDGFRPGKAPMATIARQYAPEVRRDVLGEAVQNRFGQAIQTQRIRIAGAPRFEPKSVEDDTAEWVFSAVFEVYPDVTLGDLTATTIKKPVVAVGDEDVVKTLEILRKQRRTFAPADRASREGDLMRIDFQGTLDGHPFPGSDGQNFAVVIGEERLLAAFEQNLVGLSAGDEKNFDVHFPDTYMAKELAGRQAHFTVQVRAVESAVLPDVDDAFARALGVDDGDVAKLRTEVRTNLEREVKRRIQLRLREQTMDSLLKQSKLQLPNSLVEAEIERLKKLTEADMQSKGVQTVKLSADMFREQAERRVALGLIVVEVVQKHKLVTTPAQIRALIEDQAQSYESPDEVLQWYYQSPERMQEIESIALEENVVAWVTGQAQVEEIPTSFEELMGRA